MIKLSFKNLKASFSKAMDGINEFALHLLREDLENASPELKKPLLKNDNI